MSANTVVVIVVVVVVVDVVVAILLLSLLLLSFLLLLLLHRYSPLRAMLHTLTEFVESKNRHLLHPIIRSSLSLTHIHTPHHAHTVALFRARDRHGLFGLMKTGSSKSAMRTPISRTRARTYAQQHMDYWSHTHLR